VYDLVFDGQEKTYEDLVRFFFMFHDPTTFNRQGNDIGTQYASAIFYYDDRQRAIAEKVATELQQALDQGKITQYAGKKVNTALLEATTFYPAHEEHQEYLDKNPGGYCNHYYRFKTWPSV
jgi:peptide-methionine (S)-S-oxide reductase